MKKLVGMFMLVLVLFPAAAAWAIWLHDGTPICTETHNQSLPQIVSDGAGGAIITWRDNRMLGGTGPGLIYAQKVSAAGDVQWTADGIAVTSGIEASGTTPKIATDGSGGAIITWVEFRDFEPDIWAARVNASGVLQWCQAVCTAVFDQYNPEIVSDGAGGAIITWDDTRSTSADIYTGTDIYALRVDPSGIVAWSVPLCTEVGGQTTPKIASDGAGGAIVTWVDARNGNPDIYAQRVNASGAVQWTLNGIALCTALYDQLTPRIISDGAGGAIVTWQDNRDFGAAAAFGDIYAQKVDATGVPQWTTDGVVVSAGASGRNDPAIASDGSGGAIISFVDYSDFEPDISSARVNAGGVRQWSLSTCSAVFNQLHPKIVSDGSGGAIITWDDSRSAVTDDPTGDDIYATGIDGSGFPAWGPNGSAVCTARGAQEAPEIASDCEGGAFVTWTDSRDGNEDIYAMRVPLIECEAPVLSLLGYRTVSYAPPLWQVEVELLNNGPGHADGITAVMNEDLPWLTIPDPNCDYGFLCPGERTWAEWDGYTFDLTGHPGGAFRVWFDVTFTDDSGVSHHVRLDPEFQPGTVTGDPDAISVTRLGQNYPNPFNPSTTINFRIATAGPVYLGIYDASGKLVRSIVGRHLHAGAYAVNWDGKDSRGVSVASGVYFYKLQAEAFTDTKKMILMR